MDPNDWKNVNTRKVISDNDNGYIDDSDFLCAYQTCLGLPWATSIPEPSLGLVPF